MEQGRSGLYRTADDENDGTSWDETEREENEAALYTEPDFFVSKS